MVPSHVAAGADVGEVIICATQNVNINNQNIGPKTHPFIPFAVVQLHSDLYSILLSMFRLPIVCLLVPTTKSIGSLNIFIWRVDVHVSQPFLATSRRHLQEN